jgi:hypothetical protein
MHFETNTPALVVLKTPNLQLAVVITKVTKDQLFFKDVESLTSSTPIDNVAYIKYLDPLDDVKKEHPKQEHKQPRYQQVPREDLPEESPDITPSQEKLAANMTKQQNSKKQQIENLMKRYSEVGARSKEESISEQLFAFNTLAKR